MLTIDHVAYQSRWRNVNPLAKFVAYLILLGIIFSVPAVIQITLALLLMLATVYSAKITVRRYLLWLIIPVSFLSLSMMGILLSFGRNDDMMLASVRLGSFYIGIYESSLSVAIHVVCRSFTALVATLLFVMSTPFNQLIIIGRKCKIPPLFMEITLLTYRFIFIFFEEMLAIYQIQTLRFGYISMRKSYHSLAILITLLFERVFIRYQHMTTTLKIKLYDDQFHL